MIGERLGRWRIERELGRGGMGRVYLARLEGEPASEGVSQAAVKVLAPELAVDAGLVARFHREIAILSRLRHPHIVALYESGQQGHWYYYAMEYVDGPGLDELLRQEGRLPWWQALQVAIELSQALKHAHDHGIVHRDLKPSNVLLAEGRTVKLSDFGVAWIFAAPRLTATQAVVGSVDYMSPEQAAGQSAGPRSDLYALGVVFYQMITGRLPFRGRTAADMVHQHRYARFDVPIRIVPDLPTEINDVVCQLLEKDPAHRPANAQLLVRHLQAIQRRLASLAPGMTASDPSSAPTAIGSSSVREDHAEKLGDDVRQGAADAEVHAFGAEESTAQRRWLQAAALSVLLMLVVGAIIWGLWPESVDKLLEQADVALSRDDYAELDRILAKLTHARLAPEQAARVEQLHVEGQRKKLSWQSRRRVSQDHLPAQSPAERAYRQAVLEFHLGRQDQARALWQTIVDAYDGVASEQVWVDLAKDGLRLHPQDVTRSVDEAIQRAQKEPAAQGWRRLQALRDLVKDYPEAKQKVEEALRGWPTPPDP